MEPTTGYAMLGDERIASQIIGDGPTDLILTVGWWGSFDADWDEPNIRAFFLLISRLGSLSPTRSRR